METTSAPIGMFDSGLGGLSVLREVRRLLPAEDIIYVADSAYCPYGTRPEAVIRQRSIEFGWSMVDAGAKILVVACNTATSVALPALRARLPIPVVGLVPAVKPAAKLTKNGRIGVLATPRTTSGERLESLVREFANEVEVHIQAAPGLADIVEAGHLDGAIVESALERFVRPLTRHHVDTIVLGCTHYPFLRDSIERFVGPGVTVIDSGEAVARRTRELLATDGLLRSSSNVGRATLRTSGDPALVGEVAARLLGQPIPTEPLVLREQNLLQISG